MKSSIWVLGGALVTVLCAFVLIECGSTPCEGSACGADANNVPGVSGGGCDSSKAAAQGGCAVDDSDGFFVSPAGSDAANGGKATPFQTIATGITAAAGNAMKPNVYVCAGTFPENLVIQNAPAGVALHGGFECATWTQVNANTVVAPLWAPKKTPQYVLQVMGAAALVESMTITAPDADASDLGTSSTAIFVNGSPGMTVRRAKVSAGNGADGASAILVAPIAPNEDGNPSPGGQQGATSKSCTCGSDTTVGGSGGTFGGAGPVDGLPVIGGVDGGHAGMVSNCTGGVGANALMASAAGANASTIGAFGASAWVPANGTKGASGGTGQGGGGAQYSAGSILGGGGGACGGCGGAGGDFGTGGGGSLAIVAIGATLRIQNSVVHAGRGGKGGDGAPGQLGQPGGAGGFGAGGACVGGGGGAGGQGSGGGGGAGGVSIAIAVASTTPDIDTQSTVLAGVGGLGGVHGSNGSKAIDGTAETVHLLQ